MQPFGEGQTQTAPLFYPLAFKFPVPHRKINFRLYDASTIILIGTEFPDVAYAELNDPRRLVPLTELLSRCCPSKLNHFIDLGKRFFLCDGKRYDSPYQDLFLRSFTASVELFNKLLAYEVPLRLEELQRQMQLLSRAFHVAVDGLLGCGFNWQVNLLQPVGNEKGDSVPTCSEALSGINAFPLFPSTESQYTAATAYALMAMLVLEVRFQQMEKRVQDIMTLDEDEKQFENVGLEMEKMRQAIVAAPSTVLVFAKNNPLRHLVDGFDLLVTERYSVHERTSHLSLLSLLALCKVSIVLKVHQEGMRELIRPMATILSGVLCHQSTANFVYNVGEIQQPVPVIKTIKQEPVFATKSQLDYKDEDEDQCASGDAMVEMRATILCRLGHTVDWSKVQMEQLPEHRSETNTVDLNEADLDYQRGNSDSWPLASIASQICCLRF